MAPREVRVSIDPRQIREIVERHVSGVFEGLEERAEKAEDERDAWKKRHHLAREQLREMYFEGMSIADWHLKHCAAMQVSRKVEAERDAALARLSRVEALVKDYQASSMDLRYGANASTVYGIVSDDLAAALRSDNE